MHPRFDAAKVASGLFFCSACEGSRCSHGMCVFRNMSASPHGIPSISIPVDAFDVFEATQHSSEHDSKHGRGSPSAEQ